MAEATPKKRKDPGVLKDTSLLILANGIGKLDLKALELGMQLNIPTTTIVNFICEITGESTLTEETLENDRIILAYRCILLWKEMSKDNKPRERVKMLERALKEIGRKDLGEILMERYKAGEELTKDIFEG